PAALLAAGIAAAAGATDFDPRVNFGKYHTYSWIGVHVGNSLWQDRIVTSVDCQLSARGWKRVAKGGGAAVSATGEVSERDIVQTFYDGFPGWGWGWDWAAWGGWGSGVATTYVIPQQIGNLQVDVFDGATKKLIWQGTAEKTLSHKPRKNDKK